MRIDEKVAIVTGGMLRSVMLLLPLGSSVEPDKPLQVPNAAHSGDVTVGHRAQLRSIGYNVLSIKRLRRGEYLFRPAAMTMSRSHLASRRTDFL